MPPGLRPHLQNEQRPHASDIFPVRNPADPQHGHQGRHHRCRGVTQAVAELKRLACHLSGHTCQIGQRNHDRHDNGNLSGAGTDEAVDHIIREEHENRSSDLPQTDDRDRKRIYDCIDDLSGLRDRRDPVGKRDNGRRADHGRKSLYEQLRNFIDAIAVYKADQHDYPKEGRRKFRMGPAEFDGADHDADNTDQEDS